MITEWNRRDTRAAGGFASAVLAAAVLVACAPLEPRGPEQVHANNPSVTYTYKSDQELLLASDKAATYCKQYQTTVPRSGPVTSNADGTYSVVFECVPVTAPGPTVAATPSALPVTYTYRTSQELLQASQDAETMCMRFGKRSSATITTNADGSKTATFTCVP